ncbi:MAG: HAD-IA family hydrolase [Gammaproteobacteria bacterium]
MSYRAILWDFGGVFTSSPFEAFNRYEDEHGLPRDFIRGVNAVNHEDNAWARFESSRIDEAEFDRQFRAETRAAGHEVPGQDVIALLGGEVRPRMVAVLERCKQDYACVCLTNNVASARGPGMARNPAQAAAMAAVMEKFDFVIESSKEGLRKPDPRIYALACERMGTAPGEVVYLDDLGVNLKPARAIGMTTIKVVSEEQAIADLGAVLGLALPA